jgi:hypothetical protein
MIARLLQQDVVAKVAKARTARSPKARRTRLRRRERVERDSVEGAISGFFMGNSGGGQCNRLGRG